MIYVVLLFRISQASLNKTIVFYYPSSSDLRTCCNKLGLGYHRDAYVFWSKFEIDKIASASVPEKRFKSFNNGFASISLYLTGSDGHAAAVKEALNKYFFSNMKTLGMFFPEIFLIFS